VHAISPPVLTPGKRPGTHFTGGWEGHRIGMEGCGKYCRPAGIRSPDRTARSEFCLKIKGYVRAETGFHSFFTSALGGGEWSVSRPRRFIPGGNGWVVSRLVWRRMSENRSPITLSSIAYVSHYTSWANPATVNYNLLLHQALNFLVWEFWSSQRRFSILLVLEHTLSNF
jgi:hypothetical protein